MVEARLAKRIGIRIAAWSAVVAFGALLLPGLFQSQRTSDERRPETSLKTIIAAQEDFRSKDRDEDGIRQFWRPDVTGLYVVRPGGDLAKPVIKLIELSVACADDRPRTSIEQYAVRCPKAGYWFRAIRHADETALSPDRYAVIAFPAKYPDSGRDTFVVDERKDIYRMDLGHGRGIEVFPSPAELKAKWSKLD
jgi:hypothetical protein